MFIESLTNIVYEILWILLHIKAFLELIYYNHENLVLKLLLN